MITAIALDDEPLALEIVKQFCSEHANIMLKATFNKPNAAKDFLSNENIDLVFLDIDMPTISGLEFYRSLEVKPALILVTAFQQFAIEGFDLNAIDYLLKPFSKERFHQAIDKAMQHISSKAVASSPSHIWIKADTEKVKIDTKSILWIEALDNYVKIHLLHQKPLLTRMSLKGVFELLSTPNFLRVHRSYVIAMDKIDHFNGNEIGIASEKIPIGNLYKKEVALKLNAQK